jgi:transcriptional regulator with XRE-family HTH domain
MTPGMVTYGERFQKLREALGLDPRAFVQRLGLKEPSNIQTLEQSSRVPRLATILRHAKALEVAPSELMKGVETIYDQIRAGKFDKAETVEEKARARASPRAAGRRRA